MESLEPVPVRREPRGLLGSFDELLTEPLALLERARVGRVSLGPLLAGGVVCALIIGWRFLARSLAAMGAQTGMVIWLFLFAVVSCQVATFLRPVLWRERGEALFRPAEKMFFLDHFGSSFGRPAVDAQPKPQPAARPGGGAARKR